MSQQLVKKGANGRYDNVMPKSWIEAIKDKNTGQTLVEILQGFNMYFLPYNGNTSATRCLVPMILRKKGLWITYVKYDGNVYTEWYAANEIDDKSWGDSSNWRIGNNTLVGDITISANGNWVINGTETEFKAIGEKGNTPLLRVANNKLQVSYDLGDTYRDVTNNPVYTKFRWLATSGDTQANNVGRIQASTDEGKTWTNMSNDFINNLHISKYIGADESLPTSGIAEGTIYAKGPTYDEGDTSNSNPIYRLWVYAWKGNTLAWQDNGEFTSIAAGVVQETGNSETEIMSQKAVTTNLSKLDSKLNGINNIRKFYVTAGNQFLTDVAQDIKEGDIIKFNLTTENDEVNIYNIGTSNGYYFEGLGVINKSPNKEYMYKVSEAMYKYMTDANDYNLYLYIAASNVNKTGYVNLNINYTYGDSIRGNIDKIVNAVNNNSASLNEITPILNNLDIEFRGKSIDVPINEYTFYYLNIKQGDLITLKNEYSSSTSYQIQCKWVNFDDSIEEITTLIGGQKEKFIANKDYKGIRFNSNKDNVITIGYKSNYLAPEGSILSDIKALDGILQRILIPQYSISFEHDASSKLTSQPYNIIAGVTYECYFNGGGQWSVYTYDSNGRVIESRVALLSSYEYGYFTATKDASFIGGYTSATTSGTYKIKVSDVQNGIETKYQEEYNTYISEKKQVPAITKFDNLHIISISNQSDFDNIHTIINNSVAQGYKNIAVCFSSDTFFYSEKHFNLISSVYSSCEDVNLHLFGLNTKIIPKGVTYNYKNAEGIFNGYYKYSCADKYNYKDLFVDKDGNEISTYGEVKYAESAVETVDEESSYYRFKLAYEDKDKYASYIKLSAWYTSAYEKVDKIEDGYVYFYQKQTETQINGDNHFPKVNYGTSRNIYPRYKLLNSTDSNIYLKDGYLYVKCSIEEVIYCKSKQFLELQDTFNSLTISGFIFKGSVGNSGFYYHAEKQPVGFININAFEGEFVNISNNEFNCLKDFAVRVSNNNTSNIIVNNNKCFNNYRGLIIGTSTSRNIFAINNECINNGVYAYYEGIFTMSGKNFLISNNKIVDFPYAAIRSGAEFPGKGNETEGIIENNYIKLSDKYVAESYKHCLMDQGSIYVYCEVEKLIIRHNIIINSTGQYQNNGIMLDGYASNCKILGNLVIGTNGRGICRSILSYKGNDNETKAVNNFIMNNIIDTRYRFTGWEGCIKGPNILLKTDKTVVMQNDINIPNTEDDYQIFNVIRQGDVYLIPARYEFALYKFLTINPVIASYIRFSNFN